MVLSFIIASYAIFLLIIKTFIKDSISKRLFLIYTSYWSISLFVSSLDLYGLYKVEDTTYYLLLGHIYAFLFGFVLIKPVAVVYKKNINVGVSDLLKNKFFFILFAILLIYIANLFIRQRELLAMYSLSEIRGDFSELILEGGQFTFYTTVISSMYHFSMCLAFYMLLFDRRWFYIALFLSFALFFSLLGGGRNQFMKFIYYAIGIYILKDYIFSSLKGKQINYIIPKRMKVLLALIFIGSFIGMSLFTALRKGSDTVNFESIAKGTSEISEIFVNYSICPIVAFDKCLKNKRFENEKFYGVATFCGPEQFIYKLLLRRIIVNYEPCYDKVTGYVQHNRIDVAPGRSWNYAYTSCFYYYLDFGIMGIFLYPFILGLISRCMINLLEKNLNIYSIAIFQFLSYCMYMTVFSGYLFKNVTFIYLVLMLFLYWHNRKKIALDTKLYKI